jgi:hypothetical protein
MRNWERKLSKIFVCDDANRDLMGHHYPWAAGIMITTIIYAGYKDGISPFCPPFLLPANHTPDDQRIDFRAPFHQTRNQWIYRMGRGTEKHFFTPLFIKTFCPLGTQAIKFTITTMNIPLQISRIPGGNCVLGLWPC